LVYTGASSSVSISSPRIGFARDGHYQADCQLPGSQCRPEYEPGTVADLGIGPWPRLGVTGAALATFISILVADVLMMLYFERSYHYLQFRFAQFRPQTRIWNSLLRIGLPAGAEFILISVYIIIVYSIIRGVWCSSPGRIWE